MTKENMMLEPRKERICATGNIQTLGAGRQSDVPAALDDLEKSVSRLEATVSVLWDRTHPVLREEPCNGIKESGPAYGECSVSQKVRTEAQRIDELAAGIERLTNLLEI
jgi:hypothetical protein